MADELAELRQQMADMQAKLAELTAAGPRQPQPFLELTFSGPARKRSAAVTALEEAGYTVRPVDPLHDGDSDGWVEAAIPWTRNGPVDGGFQAQHQTKACDAVEPYGYTLRASGVAAGTITR